MNPLQQIMGIQEASKKWGLTVEELAKLCSEGKLQAVRLDDVKDSTEDGPWVLLKDQPAPTASQPASSSHSPAKKESSRPRTGALHSSSSVSSRLRNALYE